MMALPAITTVADCVDYTTTFKDFLPQLYLLSNRIYVSVSDPEALKALYVSTNPAISGLAFAIALFPIFLVVSEINKNYSQVDRCWSILPTIFNVHYALWARLNQLPTQRLDHVLAFSLIWSIRLTYNYWRKGGYQIGSEDYRWALIKKYIGPAGFFVLNVVFIASIQPVLLWAVTLPTYILLLVSRVQPEMLASDLVCARLLIALVVVEHFADQQQWNFHQAKKEYHQTARVPHGWTRAQMDRGFLAAGLWRYSRHPNFAAEQSIWIALYVWGGVRSGSLWNWTVGGPMAYVLVFQGSTPITEWISGSKYPEYQFYRERVGRFVPKLFGKGWNEQEAIQAAQEGESRAVKKKARST